MANIEYNYTKTPVAVDRLEQEIRSSAIITSLRHATTLGTALTVTMASTLSGGDEAILDGIVTAHTGVPLAVPPEVVNIGNSITVSEPKDSDGAVLSRAKQTMTGWTFQDHCFEFKPSTYGSVISKDHTNANFGYCTIKFYEDVSGVETLITGGNASDQSYLDAHCIKTVVDWEPTHDFDVIAGEIRFYDEIAEDAHMWVVVVPDVPANMGGTKVLLTGRNLRYVAAKDPIVLDGRTTKHLAYNGTYHTNKFRFIIRHAVGFSKSIEVCIQLYKA